jgi:hypothetical protein
MVASAKIETSTPLWHSAKKGSLLRFEWMHARQLCLPPENPQEAFKEKLQDKLTRRETTNNRLSEP